jgi:hypothetical protein
MSDSGYHTYIAWRRLTGNGRRSRDEMSPAEQAEWDSLGIKKSTWPDVDPEEARLA